MATWLCGPGGWRPLSTCLMLRHVRSLTPTPPPVEGLEPPCPGHLRLSVGIEVMVFGDWTVVLCRAVEAFVAMLVESHGK